jgi:HEAT repeat protein/cyclophilin family peptidyl-prolyl cis-trans isomerase
VKKTLAVLLLSSAGVAASGAPAPASRIARMAAVLDAEERRDAAALAVLLRDGDAGVRRRALLAAGRIGDPSGIGPAQERLGDPVVEVRRMAAFALGLLDDAAAVDRLVTALEDADPIVRSRAAEALGRIGDRRAAPAVARMVVRALPKGMAPIAVRGDDPGHPADPWIELRLGVVALAALGDAPSAAAVLLDGGQSRFDWWAATWAAGALPAPELLPVLLTGAASSDPRARAFAATGLASHGGAAAAREALVKLARDREDDVAARALRALGAGGDRDVAPILEAALRGASAARTRAALVGLSLLPTSKIPREDVVGLVGHEDPAVRASALRLLARSDREELALVLSGLDNDPVLSVRTGVAAGLAGAQDDAAVGVLFGMLKDSDGRVVAAALDALQVTQGDAARLVLEQHLSHQDVGVRAAAARGLAALGGRVAVDALIAAYRAARRDADPEARLAIVAALGKGGATDMLRTAATEDAERAVRHAAATALVAMDETPPRAAVRARRPVYDHVSAMAPYDPAPDQPLYTPRAFLHTRRGVIEIHLNTVEAPLAVRSFIALARRGFYNGLAFHRVVPGERAESGCPRGDGRGGPGFRLPREAGLRSFGRGAVGLESTAKDAEGSRFFIALAPEPATDGQATLLGVVANGLDAADRLREDDVIDWVEIWDGR